MNNQKISGQIGALHKRIYARYNDTISLPESYNYLFGNPVQPVVPLDTARNGVFVIGAYPSAKFSTIEGIQNVPVADISGPFSNERYFDGSSIQVVKSGEELEKAYLAPLGLRREQCWITNLVKVFLFKEGHVKKYRKLGCQWPPRETRKSFEQYAVEGLGWLAEELKVAQPKIVVTL